MIQTKILLICPFMFMVVKSLQPENICGAFDGRRIYVELGKKGVVAARNVSHLDYDVRRLGEHEPQKQCRLEVISCPACIVSLKFIFPDVSKACSRIHLPNSCSCGYVWVFEPPYEDLSGQQFCRNTAGSNHSAVVYNSKTRAVSVAFFYTNEVYLNMFTLEYTSHKNRRIIKGLPGQSHSFNESATISTPFFPHPYPHDLRIEYVIQCTGEEDCRVCLVFTDFLIAKMSVIEIFDTNGKRAAVATGMTFRPSTIISSGPSLIVRFYANGASNKGFKAAYSFLKVEGDKLFSNNTNVDCGGLVDNLSGAVAIIDAVKEPLQSFDCVWIIQPSRSFLHFYTHLYLKVVDFTDFENAELSIHQGITSSDALIELLTYPFPNFAYINHKQHVMPISGGFYVRFKGVLHSESKFALAYTVFSYNECVLGTDFICKNRRCIPIYLQCDGFDHCGDNSDEPPSCFEDEKHRRWSHTSNFFFPKADQYSDFHTAAIIFLICCFGLISLVVALIILIFRINGRVRHHTEMENHLQAINDLLDDDAASVQEELIEEDDPPNYEAPPNYNDVISSMQSNDHKSTTKRGSRSHCSKHPAAGSGVREPQDQNNATKIPDSPPPAYSGHEASLPSNSSLADVAGTSRHIFLKCFSNDDFSMLKKKIIEKSKLRKKKFLLNKKQDKNLSHCLSDSEIPEISSEDNSCDDPAANLQRSFSFDDYL